MSFLNRKNEEKDLDAEIEGYFDVVTDRYIAQGLSPQEARSRARREFDGPEQIKEKVRDARVGAAAESAFRQIRYAVRGLLRSPGFTSLTILTLALGIGASTAVFTIVDTAILRPLGYRDSGRLVTLWESIPVIPAPMSPNPRHADLWNTRTNAFSGLALLRQKVRGIATGNEHPVTAGTVQATTSLFDVLQATPLAGRLFERGDKAVAVLTYGLWQKQFRADPAVVGKMVRVEGIPHRIVGILRRDFRFPNANALDSFPSPQGTTNAPEAGIFVSTELDLNDFSWGGEYGNWIGLARLKPDVSEREATARIAAVTTQIAREHNLRDLHASIQPMQETVTGRSRTALWFALASVLGLMLIACVNLANAQFGRAVSRARERAVRSALGASRWHLILISLTESVVLAVAGGLGGTLLAAGALSLFREYSPIDIPRLSEAHINLAVLGFSSALTMASCLLFGLWPALRTMDAAPQAGLRQGRGVPASLIALQVFGCTVLLLLTGLFCRSLLGLLHNDKGFDPVNVALAEVRLNDKEFKDAAARTGFNDSVLASLRQLPGVESAAMVSAMPLEGDSWIEELRRTDQPGRETPLLNLRWVSPGYFETLRQRLVAGRYLEERDRDLRNAVISEGEAKAVWPEKSAVGQEMQVEGRKFTVVGVVADSRSTSLKTAPPKMAFLHYRDRPPYALFFMVRARDNAEALTEPLRQAIWKLTPNTTIARVTTLESQLRRSLAAERFQTNLLIGFGAAALLLAMLGIYGVLSYSVAGRRKEIGVRMALGARKRSIYAMTMREAAGPVAAGLAAGLVAGCLAGGLVQKLLYGVKAVDPLVMLAIAALFAVAAGIAAFVPAQRAATVNPVEALRAE